MTVFNFGFGPVPAHRHSNGGGWVADTATVADTAYVGPDAMVSGNAEVYGNARVSGNAQMFGDARVFGTIQIDSRIIAANRSDGYTFLICRDSENVIRITAGCRYFTPEEAISHWTNTRSGTKLGAESLQIVDHLVKMLAIKESS